MSPPAPSRATPILDLADERVGSSYPRCADGNGTLTHLFFSDDQYDIARAKAICSKCGLAEGCLSGALDRAEPYGVWGGHLLVEGVIVAIKRGRGRPPKNPRVDRRRRSAPPPAPRRMTVVAPVRSAEPGRSDHPDPGGFAPRRETSLTHVGAAWFARNPLRSLRVATRHERLARSSARTSGWRSGPTERHAR